MKFVLDQQVDAAVGRFLRSRGHDCWTAFDGNLSDADDDELTAYACDRVAVLVSHDREFSQRRARNVIGHHLQLRCDEPDAVDLLTQHFEAALEPFGWARDILVQVSVSGCTTSRKWD